LLGLAGEVEMELRGVAPRVEPLLPALDLGGRADEVVVVDSLRDHPRSPVVDGRLDAGVRHQRSLLSCVDPVSGSARSFRGGSRARAAGRRCRPAPPPPPPARRPARAPSPAAPWGAAR